MDTPPATDPHEMLHRIAELERRLDLFIRALDKGGEVEANRHDALSERVAALELSK